VDEKAKRDSADTAAEENRLDCSVPIDTVPEFVAAVKRGIASAERGDFIEHEEGMARIERLLRR
jgi:hypothetical protein